MTIKEYWAIFRQKKSVLAELDRDILAARALLKILDKEIDFNNKMHEKDLELRKREAMVIIKEQDYSAVIGLQKKIESLEEQLKGERKLFETFLQGQRLLTE